MAGSITISSIQLDSDNNFSILSNTGATLVSANGSGINVAASIPANSITADKIPAASITNDKLAAPFTTGKAIAMSIVFS